MAAGSTTTEASSSRPLTMPTGTIGDRLVQPLAGGPAVVDAGGVEGVGHRLEHASTGTMTASDPGSIASRSARVTSATSSCSPPKPTPLDHGRDRRPRGPTGAAQLGRGDPQDPSRQLHVLGRDAVADGQLGPPDAPSGGQVLEDLVPVLVGPGAGGLGDVADDGHRPVERTTADHPQLHRRQVLDLVDDDVAVGADARRRPPCASSAGRGARAPRRAAGRRGW